MVPFRELANDLTGCWLQHIEEQGSEKFIVIKDDTELTYFTSCETVTGTVNFEEEFVLAGRVQLPQCGFLKSKRLTLINDKLVYRLEVAIALCLMPTVVDAFAVVPREYLVFPVKFDVVFLNN